MLRPMRFRLILALLSLVPSLNAADVLYEGARVIVNARRTPLENAALLVSGGRVVRVGSQGSVKAPKDAVRVNLSGKTVIPALLDTHIHIGYQKDLAYAAASYTRDNLADQLQRYAYSGVAAVLSLGTDPGEMPFSQRVEQERTGGTLLLLAGKGLAGPNAGPGDAALKPSAWSVATEAEARNAVRQEAARGVDFIKVWVDDRGGTVKKTPPEIYRAIIDEAHKRKLRAIAHVFYLDDAKDLARSGIDGFAHLIRDREVDDEIIALIKQHGIFVMPNLGLAASRTLSPAPAWLDEPLSRETTPPLILERMRATFASRTPQALENSRRVYALMRRNLAKLNSAEVKIILGGDSGAIPDHFHAFTSHRELEWMVDAGMSPAQALTAGTATAAEFLRLKNRGTLEAGRSADFIVLNANPLEGIASTRQIADVYLHGEKVDRAALRAGWK